MIPDCRNGFRKVMIALLTKYILKSSNICINSFPFIQKKWRMTSLACCKIILSMTRALRFHAQVEHVCKAVNTWFLSSLFILFLSSILLFILDLAGSIDLYQYKTQSLISLWNYLSVFLRIFTFLFCYCRKKKQCMSVSFPP